MSACLCCGSPVALPSVCLQQGKVKLLSIITASQDVNSQEFPPGALEYFDPVSKLGIKHISIRGAHTLGASAATYGSFTSHSAVSWAEHTKCRLCENQQLLSPGFVSLFPEPQPFLGSERYHCPPKLVLLAQSLSQYLLLHGLFHR